MPLNGSEHMHGLVHYCDCAAGKVLFFFTCVQISYRSLQLRHIHKTGICSNILLESTCKLQTVQEFKK